LLPAVSLIDILLAVPLKVTELTTVGSLSVKFITAVFAPPAATGNV